MKSARILSGLLIASAAVGLASCEVVLARSSVQCSSTAECRARGGVFATSRCSDEGFCEAIVLPEAGAAVGLGCASSGECRLKLGVAGRCVDSECRPLLPDDKNRCTIIGPAESDDAVLVGALVPRRGKAGVELASAHQAIRWVATEWAAGAHAPRARAVAVLECDESEAQTLLPHVLALRPRAFIGPFTNVVLREYLKTPAARDIPTFAPTVDDPLLVAQQDPQRKVRSCAPNLTSAVKSFQRAIGVMAARVAAERQVAQPKVVLVATNDAADAAFATAVADGLVLGGQPASGLSTFRQISVITDLHQTPPPSLLGPAQTVIGEKPDLVVLTTSDIAEEFISSMARRWQALSGATPQPAFLMMRRSSTLVESLRDPKTPIKAPIFALDWLGDAATEANYGVFAGEMLAREVTPGFGGARAADCTFAALFGAFAAANRADVSMLSVSAQQWVDGVELATTGDQSIGLVPASIPVAVSFLGASPPQKTRLIGAMAPSLAWQPDSSLGGKPGLFCVSSATASPAGRWVTAGMEFEASTGAENGSIACP